MADSLGTRVVGQPDDLRDSGAHVQCVFHEGVPEAAGIWLAERDGAAGNRVGVWILRLPAANGRAELLCDQGRPRDSVGYSVDWASMLRGGPEVGEFTVQRFFALHVVVLPALFVPLLAFHLWLVQRYGNAAPPSVESLPASERKSMPFFPNFLRKDLAMWLISLNVLALLASVFPWALGKQADSLVPAPAGIHPEWYFMSPFEMLKVLGNILPGEAGEIAGLLLFTLGIALWILIPFYDTGKASGQKARAAHYFGLLAVVLLLSTTVIGYWATR
jgi:quinol-cytochrome oxidoreductase complex cytochrome b subunit